MLINKELQPRIVVSLDKSMKGDKSSGIMTYGDNNDYPQMIEKLILGSQTAKASAGILARFIGGDGFEDKEVGEAVIGKDSSGKDVTLDRVRRDAAMSIAMFNGYYVHANMKRDGEVVDTTLMSFKDCRLSTKDDSGYCSQIAYHENWGKEKGMKLPRKNDITWFTQFNPKTVNASMGKDAETFPGQIYHAYFDNSYLYPISAFDSVFLEMDTEQQMQIFRNNQIRNGFASKVVMNVDLPSDEKEEKAYEAKVRQMLGADGDNFMLINTTFGEEGEIEGGDYKVETIDSNYDDKVFENWNKTVSNNIRKAAKGQPAVLIDFEQGTLSQASGEMITQAVKVYNAYTRDLRKDFSESLKEIYKHYPPLKDKDFKLNDVSLIENDSKLPETTGN